MRLRHTVCPRSSRHATIVVPLLRSPQIHRTYTDFLTMHRPPPRTRNLKGYVGGFSRRACDKTRTSRNGHTKRRRAAEWIHSASKGPNYDFISYCAICGDLWPECRCSVQGHWSLFAGHTAPPLARTSRPVSLTKTDIALSWWRWVCWFG